jgi:hypothetical protein
MLTNDGIFTCEIKSSIVMANAAFNKWEGSIYKQNKVGNEEETRKLLYLLYSSLCCWYMDASDSRSETPVKFWNVVLDDDGEDHFEWACDEWRTIT